MLFADFEMEILGVFVKYIRTLYLQKHALFLRVVQSVIKSFFEGMVTLFFLLFFWKIKRKSWNWEKVSFPKTSADVSRSLSYTLMRALLGRSSLCKNCFSIQSYHFLLVVALCVCLPRACLLKDILVK